MAGSQHFQGRQTPPGDRQRPLEPVTKQPPVENDATPTVTPFVPDLVTKPKALAKDSGRTRSCLWYDSRGRRFGLTSLEGLSERSRTRAGSHPSYYWTNTYRQWCSKVTFLIPESESSTPIDRCAVQWQDLKLPSVLPI